jgi:hypothetical protein
LLIEVLMGYASGMDYERDERRVHFIADHRVDACCDPANLWPEPLREAAQRDQLEISLNPKVRAGTMSLAKAQSAIANAARWQL